MNMAGEVGRPRKTGGICTDSRKMDRTWGKWMSKPWGVVRLSLWGGGSYPCQCEGGGMGWGGAAGGVQGASGHRT